MTIYSKFNNIDDEIRNEKVKKINKIIKNKYESRNHEKDAYNLSINQSTENNISREWSDIRFKDIYEYNINNLCLNLKFKTNNKNIDYTEMEKYFKNNHNIDESELLELLRTTNTDYSKTPLPILSQPSLISDEIIKKINSYNEKNGTEYGFHISDIFALEPKPKNKKGDCKYLPKFQLEKSEDGRELLINILKMIEDSGDSMNNNTIMKIAQKIQHKYDSRKSKIEHPLLILIFLPMGQNIRILQETLMRFIKENKLFEKYHCCASSSTYKSDDDGDKKFLNYVDNEMEKTKIKKNTDGEPMRGCFLFLGDQGRIGITYPDCDITISLDNGQEISKIKQTYYRSLTEADNKTVGINFDMNIQRVYSYISYVIREYKKNNNDNRSYKEILQYLYEIEQFIFNPDELGFGNSKELVIEYFEKYEEKLKSEISSETVLENIMCNDDLSEYITQLYLKNGTIINPKLEGVKPDCPEGGKKKEKVDPMKDDGDNGDGDGKTDKVTDTGESDDEPFFNINKTKRLYQFMTSLICLLLRKDKINPDNIHKSNIEILNIIKTKKEKEILLKKINDNFKISENYLNKIIDKYIEDMTSESNEYILDEIFEIYARSSPEELRKKIEEHFIPSDEQKKNNAEIPTPVELVDDMIDKLKKYDSNYFKKITKTGELCCGKGNFILALYDNYFEGLIHIKDEIERCKVIIEKCLYFADLDELNVYITKELLICHAISKMSEDVWNRNNSWDLILHIYEFKFNCYVGNSLNLNIKKIWNLDGLNCIIGNPPYNKGSGNGGSKKLWDAFVRYSIDNLLDEGYLLYVHPPGWRKPHHPDNELYNLIKSHNLLYLKILTEKESNNYFNCGTKADYYLLQKSDYKKTTLIVNSDGEKYYNIEDWPFLPNMNYDLFKKIITFNKNNNILCPNTSGGDFNKKTTDEVKKYTYIKTINQKGIEKRYSEINIEKYFVNEKKIILSLGRYAYPIIDKKGEYGLSSSTMGIKFNTDEEGENILKAVKSELFNNLLKNNKWSSFNIEWRMYTYFKEDFWKEFI